mmetsp:Transcript_3996/g.25157  ORF Transcript_3996/g.25157 Transcript_3996/m.25157 type:complete len:103 (+) Transcript_3996:171-479(+)
MCSTPPQSTYPGSTERANNEANETKEIYTNQVTQPSLMRNGSTECMEQRVVCCSTWQRSAQRERRQGKVKVSGKNTCKRCSTQCGYSCSKNSLPSIQQKVKM